MSKYYVRETLGEMTREVGYDTLAEVNDRLSELESRECKPKRLLTGMMIREAARRYFEINTSTTIVLNSGITQEKDLYKSPAMNLFLSDLADMLNMELSK